MRGTVAKRLRTLARGMSKNEPMLYRKLYQNLKRMYKSGREYNA